MMYKEKYKEEFDWEHNGKKDITRYKVSEIEKKSIKKPLQSKLRDIVFGAL